MEVTNNDLQLSPLVFLSYAKEDYSQVRTLSDRLRREGFNVWLDTHRLQRGHAWESVIEDVISRCKFFLVCLSKKSVSKTGYIQKEIRIALEVTQRMPEGSVFVIPVRLEDCDIPPSLSRWQWVDLYRAGDTEDLRADWQQHFQKFFPHLP